MRVFQVPHALGFTKDHSSLFVEHDIGIRHVPINGRWAMRRLTPYGVGKDTFSPTLTESFRDIAVEYGNQVRVFH